MANMWNLYERSFSETEVTWGLNSRLWNGYNSPGSQFSDGPYLSSSDPSIPWERTSICVSLFSSSSSSNNNNKEHEVIASCEIRLQPVDGKIPFTHISLDRLERNVADINKKDGEKEKELQPYLCNLFVSPSYRRKRLGKMLVREVVRIGRDVWEGFDGIYLHVDEGNEGGRRLYEEEVSRRLRVVTSRS